MTSAGGGESDQINSRCSREDVLSLTPVPPSQTATPPSPTDNGPYSDCRQCFRICLFVFRIDIVYKCRRTQWGRRICERSRARGCENKYLGTTERHNATRAKRPRGRGGGYCAENSDGVRVFSHFKNETRGGSLCASNTYYIHIYML